MNFSYAPQNILSSPQHEKGFYKRAYVTFMIMNDSFLPGALMFAYGLRCQHVLSDIVCMVSGKISKSAIAALYNLFDKVITVPEVFVEHSMREGRQDRPYLFSRFNTLRLGHDGDLKQSYKKIIVCDADLLPIDDYESLFSLNVPAGIINECRQNCVSYDENGHYVIESGTIKTGKWNWHDEYENICPHGHIIPRQITDRVKSDPRNMGVNASLWVLEPSMDEYYGIMEDVQTQETGQLINSFRWPEMQFATLRWSGKWTNIDLKYSSFNGYPRMDMLHGVHYAGIKPWKYKNLNQLKYFLHFPDYFYWYMQFVQMMAEHNNLFLHSRLHALYSDICAALSALS